MKYKSTRYVLILLITGLTLNSCIGSFSITNKLYQWNNSIDDKFVKALAFAGLVVVPVYEITLFADGIVFNTIEFWSGSNPVASNNQLNETQIISANGKTYKITAKKNKFIAEQIEGDGKGDKAEIVFDTQNQSWYLHHGTSTIKIVSIQDDIVKIYQPNHEVAIYSINDVLEMSHNGIAQR